MRYIMRIICALVLGITLIGSPLSAHALEGLPHLPSGSTCHTDEMSERAKSNLRVLINETFQRDGTIYLARDGANRILVLVMAIEIDGDQDERPKSQAHTYSGCLVEEGGVRSLWVPAPPDLTSNLEQQ